jgi:aspartyl-tRNA(Asn)/glutamyl-tRNA(Gln) amidotransferase subunit C
MKITDDIIEHIANIVCLEFEGEAKKNIKSDLENIVSFMEKLQHVDTENVEPLIFMSEEINRLREDIVEPNLTQSEVLKNAPKKDSDYFRIPKVINK